MGIVLLVVAVVLAVMLVVALVKLVFWLALIAAAGLAVVWLYNRYAATSP